MREYIFKGKKYGSESQSNQRKESITKVMLRLNSLKLVLKKRWIILNQ